LGGKFSFTELLAQAGLESPFIKGSIAKVLQPIEQWLEAFEFVEEALPQQ
jgi:hypothetical protein